MSRLTSTWQPPQNAHGKGKTLQVVYGVSSLTREKAGPGKLLSLFREYWKIEDGIHYRRDVIFYEDATR